MTTLFCFGFGYSAMALARHLAARGWRVSGTARSDERASDIRAAGFEPILFSNDGALVDIQEAVERATHILVSIPPGEGGDPVLRSFGDQLSAVSTLAWLGYLSTVGVYGNWDGAWVGEEDEARPVSERSKRRVAAERAWLDLAAANTLPVHIFRLAGIYGPGRNALENLQKGIARRIDKPGQVFNRIHVEDIARVLAASIGKPNPGAIYNVTDDEPSPPQDVVAYAAKLLGPAPPPLIPFQDAELSPMGRSFYGENKRVRNDRIKSELGVTLAYPTYREGLRAILEGM
ncbi:MAG: SDR family oxidoreductase [Methyloligellaceae bacterium]